MKDRHYAILVEKHRVNLMHLRWLNGISRRKQESFRRLLVDYMVEAGLDEAPEKLPVLAYGLEAVYLDYMDALMKHKFMYDITHRAMVDSFGDRMSPDHRHNIALDIIQRFLGESDEEE